MSLESIAKGVSSIANPLSAGLSAVSGIVNLFGKNRAQKKENKKQRDHEANMLFLNQAHDWNMFNATNEYNSPINQMERLREAGINPHLAYMQGGLNDGASLANTGGSGSGGMGNLNTSGSVFPDFYNQYLENKGKEKLIEKTDAEIKNINANTSSTSNADRRDEEKHFDILEGIRKKNNLTDAEINKVNKEIDLMSRQMDLFLSQIDLNKQLSSLYKKQENYYLALTNDIHFKQWLSMQEFAISYDKHQMAKALFVMDMAHSAQIYEERNIKIKGIKEDNKGKVISNGIKAYEYFKNKHETGETYLGHLFKQGAVYFSNSFSSSLGTSLGRIRK